MAALHLNPDYNVRTSCTYKYYWLVGLENAAVFSFDNLTFWGECNLPPLSTIVICLLRMMIIIFTGWFFHWYLSISVPKRKPAKQPITAFLSNRIYRNSSSDWLAGSFLFGTEIGGYQ